MQRGDAALYLLGVDAWDQHRRSRARGLEP